MKDYEITIKLQVQANDSTNDDEVLSEIMSRVNLSASLIDADRDFCLFLAFLVPQFFKFVFCHGFFAIDVLKNFCLADVIAMQD